jgi:hypothetical protein
MDNLSSKILNRCEDLELGFPGLVPQQVRELSAANVKKLIEEVDFRKREQSDRDVRRRYNNLIDILKDDQKRRSFQVNEARIQHLARLARQTGRETCECGHSHPKGANFYVTAVDGRKTLPLSGPYSTHAEAVAVVDEVRERAIAVDPGAAFASFGTTAWIKSSYNKRGILD